jgi:hypothetical protein
VSGKDDPIMTISARLTESHVTVAHRDDGPTVGDGSWDRGDWQRMWFQTQSRDWRTLALVPADDQTSAFEVANLIAGLALDHGESIRVADLRAIKPKHLDAFLEGSRWETSQGTRIVLATRSVATNPATVPIARAADCAILCVSLGTSSLTAIKDTIEQIGQKRFLGSILLRAPARSASSNRRRSIHSAEGART